MKSFAFLLCALAILLSSPRLASNPRPQGATAAASDAQTSFDVLRGLAGTWNGHVTTDPANPALDGSIQVTMRVASHDNVLVHEIAPGGVPEPTMIYVDSDRLTLIHYCEAGNRPRLIARSAPDGKSIAFDFVDISGSTSPVYLNHLGFTLIDADHHAEDWTFALANGSRLRAHFDLTRGK